MVVGMEANMNITNEVLANKIENLTNNTSTEFMSINKKLDIQSNAFITKESFELRLREIDVEQVSTKAALLALSNRMDKTDSKSWVKSTGSAILGAVLTGLISLIVYLLINQNK